MPKHSNIVQFSLTQPLREELERQRLPQETSIGLTAKRILLGSLFPDDPIEPIPTRKIEDIEAIKEAIANLKTEIENSFEARLKALEQGANLKPKEATRDSNGRFIKRAK